MYDFGSHDGRPYLVMELVDGRNLAEELSVSRLLAPGRVAYLAAQTAAGLAAAHRHGVIHRDIKPGNLLVYADDTLRIADFGIARFTDEATAGLTTSGQVIGTSAYLAPERALGRPAVPASDMYSFGCVIYELLVGHPPFRGDNAASVVHQHVATPPIPLGRLRPELPGALEDYVARLLSKEPGYRPTADEAAAWFDAWLHDRPASMGTAPLS
ncbi:serine/threonine-protein kinase [Streptomyces sp. NBC_00841]|uniref:serine/threonine-protein kinase n=1 Tax=Streptomyces sp. NBC_00841 TaxID=2975847 RepID=UPI002DDA9171|nr:serine/threonine-protein kinase [Streptomyces sp. NBC_00841]